MASTTPTKPPVIWWNNAIFFCGTHLAAAYGIYRRPPSTVPGALLVATIVLFQLAMFGCLSVLGVKVFASNGSLKGSPLGTIAYTLIELSMRPLAYVPYSR